MHRIGFYELLSLLCIGAVLMLAAVNADESPMPQLRSALAAAVTFAVLHVGDRRW